MKNFIYIALILSSTFTSIGLFAMGGPGGGGGGDCFQYNTLGTITSCTNCTIVDGSAGGDIASDANLSVNATACGPVTLNVNYSFDWNQGAALNWIHGVSFTAGPLWTSYQSGVPAGWVFMPSGVTGECSGNSYGPGYYFDNSAATSAPSQLQISFVGPGMCTATWTNNSGCNAVCNSNESLLGLSTGP